MAETDKKTTAPAKNASKKAVITTGGKQYLVQEGQELEVELLDPSKNATFQSLMVIEGNKISVGKPFVAGSEVKTDILEQVVKADKVVAIRYKAKKRVHKRRGHRQKLTRIKIKSIGVRG